MNDIQRLKFLAGLNTAARTDEDFSVPDGSADHSLEEKAPPGMEDLVMKLKKEYPDDHSKAFATAWSIYNKKHGKTDECSMYEDAEEESTEDSESEETEIEEDFDLNNGYDDENYARGSDYFPSGADSPVVKDAGPSGARQGDNPEQKRMQVDEVHKELVYNYRKFISESKK